MPGPQSVVIVGIPFDCGTVQWSSRLCRYTAFTSIDVPAILGLIDYRDVKVTRARSKRLVVSAPFPRIVACHGCLVHRLG